MIAIFLVFFIAVCDGDPDALTSALTKPDGWIPWTPDEPTECACDDYFQIDSESILTTCVNGRCRFDANMHRASVRKCIKQGNSDAIHCKDSRAHYCFVTDRSIPLRGCGVGYYDKCSGPSGFGGNTYACRTTNCNLNATVATMCPNL